MSVVSLLMVPDNIYIYITYTYIMLLQEYLRRKKSKSFLCWAFLSCVQDELYQSARIPINLTAAPYQPTSPPAPLQSACPPPPPL